MPCATRTSRCTTRWLGERFQRRVRTHCQDFPLLNQDPVREATGMLPRQRQGSCWIVVQRGLGGSQEAVFFGEGGRWRRMPRLPGSGPGRAVVQAQRPSTRRRRLRHRSSRHRRSHPEVCRHIRALEHSRRVAMVAHRFPPKCALRRLALIRVSRREIRRNAVTHGEDDLTPVVGPGRVPVVRVLSRADLRHRRTWPAATMVDRVGRTSRSSTNRSRPNTRRWVRE